MTMSPYQDLSDDELDAYVLVRLAALGVDLSVLPEEDEDAPADRRRVLEGARRFLRTTPAAILALGPTVDSEPPILYPSALARALREGVDDV
jgi:hypothetical protein